jgi:hypothetical protein
MKLLRHALLLLAAVSATTVSALAAAPAATPHSLAPYFTPAGPGPKAPTQDGFIQRWFLLEPIPLALRSNAGFVDSYIRRELTREYFPGTFTVFPRAGDAVMVEGERLLWHARDATGFNVKLFRFASGLEKRVYGVLFWAVTVVECPQEIKNVRLAVGSNSASMWWLNGEEAVTLTGDRRMVVDDSVSPRIHLKQGRNVLRGAVINGPGMSDFCVRFIDENGNPVTNYTVTLESPRS